MSQYWFQYQDLSSPGIPICLHCHAQKTSQAPFPILLNFIFTIKEFHMGPKHFLIVLFKTGILFASITSSLSSSLFSNSEYSICPFSCSLSRFRFQVDSQGLSSSPSIGCPIVLFCVGVIASSLYPKVHAATLTVCFFWVVHSKVMESILDWMLEETDCHHALFPIELFSFQHWLSFLFCRLANVVFIDCLWLNSANSVTATNQKGANQYLRYNCSASQYCSCTSASWCNFLQQSAWSCYVQQSCSDAYVSGRTWLYHRSQSWSATKVQWIFSDRTP